MTVCIAALFRWNYAVEPGGHDWGWAALGVSDRMITAGDIEYEPYQQKVGIVTPHIAIFVAGDYTVHSQAMGDLMKRGRADPSLTPLQVANLYSAEIQSIRRREAEISILSPLGLNTDTFMAQQKEMSERFVDYITTQMQSFDGPDVAAVVVGADGTGILIYEIDKLGVVRCYNDVGFTAIGIGAWHAKSRLMQIPYSPHSLVLAQAGAAVFAAKKAAEIAPGVGKETDILLVGRNGVSPLFPRTVESLHSAYASYLKGLDALQTAAIDEVNQSLTDVADANTERAPPTGTGERAGDSEEAG